MTETDVNVVEPTDQDNRWDMGNYNSSSGASNDQYYDYDINQ